jgi:DNA-binding HxlR family transcriptional regulator
MNDKCPIYNTAVLIGKRWSILILAELQRGGKEWKRYSEVKRGLPGITPKMLSMRLRELEKDGLIKRRVEAQSFPISSEYSLTDMGKGLVSVIRDMRQWAIKWNVKNSYCESASCDECDI